MTRPLWRKQQALDLFAKPFNDLLFQAQTVHREHFDPNAVQVSTLLSIKTGACPEDCKYCSQSARYDTGLERERLLPLDEVVAAAETAKAGGATRFCMGAAWRQVRDGEAFDRSIDVHVSRIRAAIEDDPKRPRRILTVRGAGYVFARVQDDDA